MTKKFSIKKLVAGVMAAAMVVTALPVSGLTVKAADETLNVYRSYNPNDGEHLYTTDAAEHNSLVAAGRSNEGVKFTLPKTSKTPVWRVYNPNTGEHLLVPEGEAAALAAIGWSNEGIKMYSDDNQGMPIYRVYNPNARDAGGHLYTASLEEAKGLVAVGWTWDGAAEKAYFYAIANNEVKVELSSTTPRVGDTITVSVTPEKIATGAKYQWSLNGKDVDAETSTKYTVPASAKAGDIIVCTVTGSDGKTYKSENAVVSLESAVLLDASGLQADGNGLVGDTLKVTYTTELGNPSQVTWYRDGTAIITKNAQTFGGLDFELTAANTGDPGVYCATITTGDGKNFTSNSIFLSEEEQQAVLSDLSIADYTAEYFGTAGTPTHQSFATNDERAVITFTVNKAYDSQIYVYGKDETSYAAANRICVWGTGGDSDLSCDAVASKAALTDKAALDKNAGGTYKGIYYTDQYGKTTYKLVTSTVQTGKSFTRGSEYKLVFNQANISSDDPSATNKTMNISESFKAPYLPAPVAIKATDVSIATGMLTASAELYSDEKATTPLAFLGSSVAKPAMATVGLTVDVKAVTDNKAEGGTSMITVPGYSDTFNAGKHGSWAIATGTNVGAYATVKTVAGIYGPKAVSLTSDFVSIPAASATKVSVSYDATAPKDVKVNFTGLLTGGTVFVVRTKGTEAVLAATGSYINAFNNTTAVLTGDMTNVVGKATVVKGQASVEVKDVVDDIYNTTRSAGDLYTAVFVPTKNDDFSPAVAVTDPTDGDSDFDLLENAANVKATITKYSIEGSDKSSVLDGTTKWVGNAKLKTADQFGEEMATTDITLAGTDFTKVKMESDPGNIKVAVTSEKIYVNGTTGGRVDGQKYTYKLGNGQSLVVTVSDASADKVSVGIE